MRRKFVERKKDWDLRPSWNQSKNDPVQLLGHIFDGRRDRNTFPKSDDGFKGFYEEQLFSLCQYLTHVVPITGTHRHRRFYDSEDVVTVSGAVGWLANTGHDSGAIHLFEIELDRPAHWAICLLHCTGLLSKNFRHKMKNPSKTCSSPAGTEKHWSNWNMIPQLPSLTQYEAKSQKYRAEKCNILVKIIKPSLVSWVGQSHPRLTSGFMILLGQQSDSLKCDDCKVQL